MAFSHTKIFFRDVRTHFFFFFTSVDVIAMSMKMQYIEKHSTNALFKD